MDFLTTPLGSPIDRTLTITNTGNATLTLTNLSAAPAGYSVVSSFSSPVAPGNSTTLVLRLNAAVGGSPGGTVSFDTNVTGTSTFSFSVIGTVQSTLSSGLVSYWKLDETSGIVAADSSGNTRHANYGQYAPLPSLDKPSAISFSNARSLEFNGINTNLNAGSNTAFSPSQQSIAFWMKANNTSDWKGPLAKTASGQWGNGWGLYFYGGNLRYYVSHYNSFISAAFPSMQWAHVATTWDGVTGKIYVNGVLVSSAPLGGSNATNSELTIGSVDTSGLYHFSGLLDDVRIYNRILSQTEITALASGSN